jgi:acetyl-CoA/propionyl-CoA carboxylase biotin carboxyl carrier protein
VKGETCEGVVESKELAEQADRLSHLTTKLAGGSDGRLRARMRAVEIEGRRFGVRVLEPEPAWAELWRHRAERRSAGAGGAARDAIVSPMQGTVLAVEVEEGEAVVAGQVLCVVEAMKMENEVHAHRDGVVTDLSVEPGQPVSTGQVICVVSAA